MRLKCSSSPSQTYELMVSLQQLRLFVPMVVENSVSMEISGDLCRDRGIKQEFTPPDSPEMNGTAERALGLIESSAMAARLQAKETFAGILRPPSDRLWAESMRWACDCLNRTATTANPQSKSPYEMWFDKPADLKLLPFLKPGFCRQRRLHKLEPKAQECYYLGPPMNHPHDAMRVLTKGRIVVTTRNVAWRRISGTASKLPV